MIKELFKKLGILENCVFVYNGEELVLKFSELTEAKIPVKFIITDFMMPRMNGFIALQKINEYISQQDGIETRPKMAFLTAFKTQGFIEMVQPMATDIFEKPLLLTELTRFLSK